MRGWAGWIPRCVHTSDTWLCDRSGEMLCGKHTHCQFIHIHIKNIPARCRPRCKVCILAARNFMTASIIEMAVCFIKKSHMALPDVIEQPAKELWLLFSPSSSTCTIRTLVWLNTCWWDCLHSSQLSRKKVHTGPLIVGDPMKLTHNLWTPWVPAIIQWEGYVTPLMWKWKISYIPHHVEIDLSDLWSHHWYYTVGRKIRTNHWPNDY